MVPLRDQPSFLIRCTFLCARIYIAAHQTAIAFLVGGCYFGAGKGCSGKENHFDGIQVKLVPVSGSWISVDSRLRLKINCLGVQLHSCQCLETLWSRRRGMVRMFRLESKGKVLLYFFNCGFMGPNKTYLVGQLAISSKRSQV
ncbi:hypothetical protein PoB_005231000 [Plakobranchus ocellatus]|uniref:Uncharacterized protein n=1 Tax=Plakobranchus ocellatus TaxID=259542 RepID=A0AAV4C2F4_9GAST|nr:hypothetical protein PoB_005231000 [Plakobranchus ocellatus]